ncbi:MAG: hypothetical protein ACRDCC_08410 [Culicoidibacterales bacterium]
MEKIQSKAFIIQDEQLAFFSVFANSGFYNLQSGTYRYFKVLGTKHEFVFFMKEDVFAQMNFSETEDGGIFMENAQEVGSYLFEQNYSHEGEVIKTGYLDHSLFYVSQPQLEIYTQKLFCMPIKNNIDYPYFTHEFIEEYSLKNEFELHHHKDEQLKTFTTQAYIFTDLNDSTVGFGYVGGRNDEFHQLFENKIEKIFELYHAEEQ